MFSKLSFKVLNLILITFITTIPVSQAQVLTESQATGDITTLEKTKILLLEVSFKNSEADFVKFTVTSAPVSPINLKGLVFQDDNIIKTISTDFWATPGEVLTLNYKQTLTDQSPNIYSSKTGLTATTEQIAIGINNGGIFDMVCWTSKEPTASEIKDIEDFYHLDAWKSSNVTSCISSEEVETNGYIKRNDLIDSNTQNDWNIINPNEELPQNDSSESVNTDQNPTSDNENNSINTPSEDEPDIINNDDTSEQDYIINETENSNEITIDELPETQTIIQPTGKKEPTTKSKKKTDKKKSSKKKKQNYKNGDEYADIIISELFPNPSEPDQKNEWIELQSNSDQTINLGNWIIDDDESGGSKPYILPDTLNIDPRSTVLVPITESKISLSNKQDKVRLLNWNEEVIDEIEYQDAGEDMAFARIEIIQPINSTQEETTETNWMWIKDASPGTQNPPLYQIEGTITTSPDIRNQPYSMQISTSQNQTLQIYFDEETIKAPLAETLFTPNSIINLLLKSNEDGKLWIQKYEIVQQVQLTENSTLIPWLIGGFCLSAASTYFYIQKKFPWQNKASQTTQITAKQV